MHAKQIERLFAQVTQGGNSIIPLKLYFKGGKVKIEIGLGKGKKIHDKRETLKQRSANREIAQVMKNKNR